MRVVRAIWAMGPVAGGVLVHIAVFHALQLALDPGIVEQRDSLITVGLVVVLDLRQPVVERVANGLGYVPEWLPEPGGPLVQRGQLAPEMAWAFLLAAIKVLKWELGKDMLVGHCNGGGNSRQRDNGRSNPHDE